MSVDISAGSVVIPGTQTSNQGSYLAKSTSVENRAIATAPSSGTRIDLVVAVVRDSAVSGSVDEFELEVVTGTSGATPSAPSAPDNSVVLAQVLVGTSVSSILDGAITDARPRSKPYLVADGLTMDQGDIVMDGQTILMTNGGRGMDPSSPTHPSHLTRKGYVDSQRDSRVAKTGDSMSGNLNMGNNQVAGLGAPTESSEATRKSYVDDLVFGSSIRQSLSGLNSIAMGSTSNTLQSFSVTLPSGWGSMLVWFNGAHEWAMKAYSAARYEHFFETGGGTTISAGMHTIVRGPSPSVWYYNTVPLFGSLVATGNFNVRIRTLASNLEGSAPSSQTNVISSRRQIQVLKIRMT